MAVPVKEAAEYYGLEVNRGNMVCCPFHADRTPSMKLNEDYFYCFGCEASDAASKLAADFGIAEQKPSVLAKLKCGKTQVESKRHCFRVLRDYFGILQDWKDHCAPQSPEDPIDPRYVEACHMLDRIGNMLDILISGTPNDRAEVVADLQKDDRLGLMEERNRQIREVAYEQS